MTTSGQASAGFWNWSFSGGGDCVKCFVRGTRILTPVGEVEVERLSVGDLIVNASGEAKPIMWLSKRVFTAEEARAEGRILLPVKIHKSAFGEQVPHRDLYVSGGHGIFIDGVIVPAGDLVNGRTITQSAPCDDRDVEYYHIEFEDHDVIIAEGAACESLLVEEADLSSFVNGHERDQSVIASSKGEPMTPFAENVGMKSRKSLLASRIRSAVSPIVDRRTQFDLIRDRIEERSLDWPTAA